MSSGKLRPSCIGLNVLNWAIIGSGNGLSHAWHQAIIWAQYRLIVDWTFGIKLQSNWNQNTNFIDENKFEKVPCKMAAILSQPQCFSEATAMLLYYYNYIPSLYIYIVSYTL